MSTVIQERTARSTGTVVQVIDNRDGSFDADDLPWFTVCADHAGVCSHPTRKLALDFAPVPDEWCSGCQTLRLRERLAELAEIRTELIDSYVDFSSARWSGVDDEYNRLAREIEQLDPEGDFTLEGSK